VLVLKDMAIWAGIFDKKIVQVSKNNQGRAGKKLSPVPNFKIGPNEVSK
jgi:hypothetical protein